MIRRMWPPAALDFLRELEANNDRDWFKANRDRYNTALLEPARELAAQLAHLGEPRFFRPWNNTRFRPGPPLKEHIAFSIGDDAAVYYVSLSLDGLVAGAGIHHPDKGQLERFRSAIADGRRAATFEQAVATASAAGLELAEPELKRAPKGYSPDHPRIDRLRLKRMTLFHRSRVGRWLHSSTADDRVRAELDATRPFVTWLGTYVGPSTQPQQH
jgi:uncharacterized protein (TIGR02453 family)